MTKLTNNKALWIDNNSKAIPPLIVPIYPAKRAKQLLQLSASAWVAIALIGQGVFATYVFVLYVFPIVAGNPELIDLSKPVIGYVKGDTFGKAALFFHVIPAALLSVGAIIQLLPIVHRKFPAVHRWNGRMFLSLGLMGHYRGFI